MEKTTSDAMGGGLRNLRFGGLKKLYCVLSGYFLFVAAIVVLGRAVGHTTAPETEPSIAAVALSCIPMLVTILVEIIGDWYPMNMILLVPFALYHSYLTGFLFVVLKDWLMLEAASVTTALICVAFALYTCWAAKRGREFGRPAQVLMILSLVPLFYLIVQTLPSLCGCLAAIAYSGFITFYVYTLTKRQEYKFADFHVSVMLLHSVSLYILAVTNPLYCSASTNPLYRSGITNPLCRSFMALTFMMCLWILIFLSRSPKAVTEEKSVI